MKKRRTTSWLWLAISSLVLIIIAVLTLTLISNEYINFTYDILITTGSSLGVFWCLYAIRFCFKRAKYSFVISTPEDYKGQFLSKISYVWWLWLIAFPIIAAAAIPVMYMVFVFPVVQDKTLIWARVIVVLCCVVIISINNLTYLVVIKKIRFESVQGFELKT